MTETPLPLWFSPEKDEPAHGILIRLAERNGIEGFTRVSDLTGLRVARLRVGNGVERLASIIRCDPVSLMNSTATSDASGNVLIRGERLSIKRDLSRVSRRLCPECVADSAHHRFWWDLKFVTTCPKHRTKLVDVCSCGKKLSWIDVRIAKCRHCEDGSVTSLPKTRANHDVQTMDQWVLARLGIGQSEPVPILDKMSLTYALDTMGRIGALDLGGYRENWAQPHDFAIPEAKVRARGFRILESGRLDYVLDKVYSEFIRSKSPKHAAVHSAYGWFGQWFTARKSEKFSPGLAEILLTNASRKFEVNPRTFPTLVQAPRAFTLTEAAKKIGMSTDTLLALLEAEGTIRKDRIKWRPIAVPHHEVIRIADEFANRMRISELASHLSVGRKMAEKLRDFGGIPVWIATSRQTFRRRDVDNWVDRLIGTPPSLACVPADGLVLADIPRNQKIPTLSLVQAIRERKIAVIGSLVGHSKFGGAILRASDVKASVPPEITKKLGSQRRGPRGPYGPQKNKRVRCRA